MATSLEIGAMDILKFCEDFASCLIHGKCYSKIHKVRDIGLHPMARKTDPV